MAMFECNVNSNLGLKKVKLGTFSSTKTINVASYEGYKNFSKDNFVIEPVINENYYSGNNQSGQVSGTCYVRMIDFNITYNNSTGDVTANGGRIYLNVSNTTWGPNTPVIWVKYNLYLVY